MALQLKMEILP